MENRFDIINFLASKYGYTTYLEIGIRNPEDCFDHIKVDIKMSVDPGFESAENKATYKFTSDEFFTMLESGSLDIPADYSWDIIFVDGLHLSRQVRKDIDNSLRHLSEKGTIVVHDCTPPTEHYARCYYHDFATPAMAAWNGTVWKEIYRSRCERADVDICVVNRDWGCAVIRRGQQELCDFDNPFYEFDIFADNRVRHLNLIEPSELNEWLDSPFYRSRHRW